MRNPHQNDLFDTAVFPSRIAVAINLDRFRLRIKQAMSQAAHGKVRSEIASAMSAMPGLGMMSAAMLDNYMAPSKNHDISLARFKAFVRAVEAPLLWDIAVSDDGLTVLQGDEARLAEIARLEQEMRAARTRLKALMAEPVLLPGMGGPGKGGLK